MRMNLRIQNKFTYKNSLTFKQFKLKLKKQENKYKNKKNVNNNYTFSRLNKVN